MSTHPPLVTNQYGTIGGRDREDDEPYRYRIQLSLSSQTGCSEPDIRSELLKIPGIQDVVFERLSGTYNVYVYGISPDLPQSLIDMVQSVVDRLTAYPLTGTALAPDRVGISLATTVSRSNCCIRIFQELGSSTRCRLWAEATLPSRAALSSSSGIAQQQARPVCSLSALPYPPIPA